jgi:hypothetical protein
VLDKGTTIRTYETTKKELGKLIGRLESLDGKKRSYDEASLELPAVLDRTTFSY